MLEKINTKKSDKVSNWRRRTKEKLVEYFGSRCTDCSVAYPPYVMQFDHKDPAEKEFKLSSGSIKSFERTLEEAKKCDLVCGNCHAERTHRQRCIGCKYCNGC